MSSRHKPNVTVLMSVFDGARHLRAAIKSVLDQTQEDFELLIIDDGSTDSSAAIVARFKDSRIRLLRQTNRGLVASLNRGISEARGSLIARLDADDLSNPTRLEKQSAFLDAHPAIVMVGSSVAVLDSENRALGSYQLLLNDPELRAELLLRNPFAHGSVMYRTSEVRSVNGYRKEYPHAEDYDLWRRLARVGKMANIADLLYTYRENPAGVSHSNRQSQQAVRDEIRAELWQHPSDFLGHKPLMSILSGYRSDELRSKLIRNHVSLTREAWRRGHRRIALRSMAELATASPALSSQAFRALAKRRMATRSPR